MFSPIPPKPLEINGQPITVRPSDGYIHATEICNNCCRIFGYYTKQKGTKRMLLKLSESMNMDATQLIRKTFKGPKHLLGSWIHPVLLTPLILWINADFLVPVIIWVDEWKKYSIANENRFSNQVKQIKPDSLKDDTEAKIQKLLHKKLGGEIEVGVEAGFIDLLTETKLIEIKYGPNWKNGIGQLIAYGSFYPKHDKVLYLFDHYDDNKKMIIDICSDSNISVKFIKSD